MTRSLDHTPELLGHQGRALRGLARSLLGDPHAAEDVVQETWITCLKHPGALPVRVTAWLATVTKRLALRRKRGEKRLRAREAGAAAPERLEALQQRSLEREEALRAVTQALLALEEPYKTALLLRYYEDRTPLEIAAELGEPLSTVKSRLARGLEKLRARLGRDFAGDEARGTRALRALAGLPAGGAALGGASTVSTATTIGALGMGMKLEAAVVVLLATGGAFAWWSQERGARSERTGEAAPGATAEAAGEASPAAAPSSGAAVDMSADGTRRESVAVPAPEVEAAEVFPPEASFPYSIRGQIRDESDLPVAGARVFLAPRGFPLNRVAMTDDEGRFAVAFDGRRPAFDCAFTVDDGGGRALGLRELHLVSGQELVVDVGLNGIANRGARLLELGLAEAEVVVRVRAGGSAVEPGLFHLRAANYAPRMSGPLDRAPESLRRTDGRAVFVDPPPAQACARPLDLQVLTEEEFTGGTSIDTGNFVLQIAEGAALELDLPVVSFAGVLEAPADEGQGLAGVRGVVRDASGDPVAGAEVCWGLPGRTVAQLVTCDENGAFALANVPPGEVVLRAGGGDQGVARERVTLAPGQELLWSPLLDRGEEVAGRVVLAPDGKPAAGVLIELWSASSAHLWSDSTLANEDGRFALPNVPAGELELHVYASGTLSPPSTFPVRIVRPVFAGTDLGELVLAPADVASHSLSVELFDASGEVVPGAELRCWQAATGRGVFAGEPDEHGKVALAGLPTGSYRLEAGSPFGWRDLGSLWVDEDTELAPERFASTALALLNAEPAGEPLPVSLWSAHPDVFGRVDARELSSTLLALRAGEYVLCAAPERGKRSESVLALAPAELRALTLAATPAGEVSARPGAADPVLAQEAARAAECASCHRPTRAAEGAHAVGFEAR